jgi:uncharacterized protein YciI
VLAILFYEYVEGVADKRTPHRDGHLGLLRELHDDGRVKMAGAFSDPLDGAAIVFSDRKWAQEFAERDPYVANGLVTRWHIRDWNVVIGA